MSTGVDDLVIGRLARQVAATANQVDANELPASTHFADLAEHHLLDQGIDALLADPTSVEARDLRPMAATIATLAEECMSTAFGLWADRMVLEYFARGERSPLSEAVFEELRAAERVGCTAMAAGLKSLAGVGDLSVTATPVEGGWRLDGRIAWASNLVEDAIVVLPASTPDGSIVAWLPVGTAGFNPRQITGLLALDATASGTVALEGVEIRDDQVLSRDLPSFAQGFRPTFLVLQSAFCAGLIRRSVAESESALDRPENGVFTDKVADLRSRVEDFLARWDRLASDVSAGEVREYLQLRLDASHLAVEATRLETTLAGGRGYLTKSGASRRFREAAFLPVQSPSEGHLTWELQSLSSTGSTPATDTAAS